VTSTPELEKATLADFLEGDQRVEPSSYGPSSSSGSGHHHATSSASSARQLDLFATTGETEAVKAAPRVPFTFLYPALQTGSATQQEIRPYDLRDPQRELHSAYVIVWQTNLDGGYYDFEGTDWLDPPLFSHSRTQTIDGREYKFVDDGSHIHVIGWISHGALYWVTNTLLEELSNAQMIAIAKSAQSLH
jgi:hypothetical protein